MNRRGATAVEFALSLPFVLMLVVGTVDFAMWTSTLHRLSRAVHDGARVGTATLTDDPASDPQPILDATEAAIRSSAELSGLDVDLMTVATEWAVDDDDVSWVRVTARVPFVPLMPFGTPFERDVAKEFWFVPKEQPHL